MRHKFLFFIVICALVGGGLLVWKHGAVEAPAKDSTTHPGTNLSTSFNKKAFSLTDPASIWVIVPGNESMQLRQPAATALEQMFQAAQKDGVQLMLSSGYRSYTYQVNLYNGYVASQGQAIADTQSARPGFSEHQTGLAADIEPLSKNCEVEQCFGQTTEGSWVAANAYKYGFIIRYQAGDENITGYEPEPWHVRFIGTGLASEMHRSKTRTLEKFFGVSGGKTYAQ
jgi:D-alanyl-D-alanine carboxypeptidase